MYEHIKSYIIRQSRLVLWLPSDGLCEVEYPAGKKSTLTERDAAAARRPLCSRRRVEKCSPNVRV